MIEPGKFQVLLKRVQELCGREEGVILFTPPFATAIVLREGRSLTGALTVNGLSEDEVRLGISEITDLIQAELQRSLQAFIGFRDLEDDLEAQAEARRRQQLVATALVDDALRRRYALKRLSKAPAFADLDWDIKVKVADANDPDFEEIPYATIKFKYQRDFGDDPFVWFQRGVESAQINFTREEVSFLIGALQRVERGLRDAEGKKLL